MATGPNQETSSVKKDLQSILDSLEKPSDLQVTNALQGVSPGVLDEGNPELEQTIFAKEIAKHGYEKLLDYEEDVMFEEGTADPRGFYELLQRLKIPETKQLELMSLYKKLVHKLRVMGVLEEEEESYS